MKERSSFIKRWGVLRYSFYLFYTKVLHSLGFFIARVSSGEQLGLEKAQKHQEFVVTHLSQEEALGYADNKVLDMPEAFINDAFQSGSDVFGAFANGQLVAYAWVASQPVVHEAGIYVKFDPQCRYNYKAFVLPEYRGQRLMRQLNEYMANYYFLQGKNLMIGFVEIVNYASIATSKYYDASTSQWWWSGYAGYWSKGVFFVPFRTPKARAAGFQFFRPK